MYAIRSYYEADFGGRFFAVVEHTHQPTAIHHRDAVAELKQKIALQG